MAAYVSRFIRMRSIIMCVLYAGVIQKYESNYGLRLLH